MASDGNPGPITGVSPVTVSQVSSGKGLPQSGKGLSETAASIPGGIPVPQSGKTAAIAVSDSSGADAKSTTTSRSAPQTLVEQVNKYLNDSGRPDQFRVDPTSANYIQQVNPATGAVIAQYSVSEFPALARSVGASGLLIDDSA